jgi:hypothetical protein
MDTLSMTYTATVILGPHRAQLEIPARDAEFAPGLHLELLDKATIRLGVADTTAGVPAWQGVSNPMEKDRDVL